MTIVLGWLSAIELFKKSIDANYVFDNRLLGKIKTFYKEGTWYWGESATPYFIAMSQFAYQTGDQWYSSFVLVDLIAKITVENTANDGLGFPSPYYSAEQILTQLYKLPERELSSDCFLGSSYHLSTIVDMLVRKKKRISLTELWKSIPIHDLTFVAPAGKDGL